MRTQAKQRIWQYSAADGWRNRRDVLTGEEPLEMQLSEPGQTRTLAITMRTPGHDYELTAGFLYSEGIIRSKEDISQMTYCVGEEQNQQEYNMLSIQLRGGIPAELPQLERHFFTNSACGVCGTAMLDDLEARNIPPAPDGPTVAPALLCALPDRLRQAQIVFEQTGGLHAAALFTREGRLVAVREDIGRHNALDKLVGWGLLHGKLPFHDHLIFVSGRASYELLQKCASAGAPIFCAVSAPSTLAIALAERFNITLIGFLRESRFNVYTGRQRLVMDPVEIQQLAANGRGPND